MVRCSNLWSHRPCAGVGFLCGRVPGDFLHVLTKGFMAAAWLGPPLWAIVVKMGVLWGVAHEGKQTDHLSHFHV